MQPLSINLPHDPYVGQRVGNYVYTARGVWECRGCGADSCDMPGWFSPIAIGPNPPKSHGIWFNTTASQLQVWNQTTAAWSVASATVVVGPAPGTPIPVGQLWQDATGWLRAWQGNVWLDICMPVPGAVQPAAGTYPVVVSLTQPGAPVTPSLWLDPSGPRLDLFSAAVWSHLGIRPARLVRTLIPPGTAQQAAPWAAGAQAGSFIHVAMQRGIDPATGNQLDPTLVTPTGLNRVQQAFANLQAVAAAEDVKLTDIVRLAVYTTNMVAYQPLIDQVITTLWGPGPWPALTLVGVLQLPGADTATEFAGGPPRGDIVGVEGTFYKPCGCGC